MVRLARAAFASALSFYLVSAPVALAKGNGPSNPGATVGANIAAIVTGVLVAVFSAVGGLLAIVHWTGGQHEKQAIHFGTGLVVAMWVFASAAMGKLAAAIAKSALSGF